MQFKKSPFAKRYGPDQYETQQRCDKVILEKGGTLEIVSDCHRNQYMRDKAVDN